MGSLREWGAVRVLDALPAALRPPLVTGLAACPERVAVAAQGGPLWLYDRRRHRAQRLRPENTSSPITAVQIVSSVDFMIAAGNRDGQITVFQVPKEHPNTVPEYLKPKSSQVERFTVSDLHKSSVTCLEWSKNGMRLFSGDKNGVVVLTEIDFYMHICKSSEIINETYEIVQLSYYQNRLLVSSVYRAIVCQQEKLKWNVSQVGTKDRKSLCKLGGIIHHNYDTPNDVKIYSARPGLKIWTSDLQGNVLETVLFKNVVENPVSRVELMNLSNKKLQRPIKDMNFGPLYIFNNKYLVTHNEELLYILDPTALVVIAVINNLKRIMSITVNKDEIFILEGERNIIRIGYHPDIQPEIPDNNSMFKSFLSPIQMAVNTIKDLTNNELKKQIFEKPDIKSKKSTLDSPDTISDETVYSAEECLDLPPIKQLDGEIDSLTIESDIPEYRDISEFDMQNEWKIENKNKQNIDEIEYQSDKNCIMHSTKRCKQNIVIPETNDKTSDIIERKEATSIGTSKTTYGNLMNVSYYSENYFPLDDRSPEAIDREIMEMEEKLAKALNLEPVVSCPFKSHSTEDLSEKNDSTNKPTKNEMSKSVNCEILKMKPTEIENSESNNNHQNDDKTNDIPKTKTVENDPEVNIPPACVSIPNVWNLKEIKIESQESVSSAKTVSAASSSKNTKRNLKREAGRLYDADWELI